MRRHHRRGRRVEVERLRILRIAQLARHRVFGLVAQDERVGEGVAGLVQFVLARVILLEDRIRIAHAQAQRRQRAQQHGVGVLGLVQVVGHHLPVLLLDGGHGLAVLAHQILAVGVLGDLGRPIRPGVLHGLVLVVQHVDLVHVVIDRDAVGQMPADGALRMVGPVGDGHDREDHQGGDLNDIDAHVDGRAAVDAAIGDVADDQRKADAEEPHEQRAVIGAAEGVRPELVGQIPRQDGRHADHQARIHPVVQMTGPAGEKLGDARKFKPVGLGQERLLGVEVGGARAGIELGEFGIADGRGEAQQQRGQQPDPHGAAGHGRAVEGLLLERQPQEGARRDQGHGVDGQPG